MTVKESTDDDLRYEVRLWDEFVGVEATEKDAIDHAEMLGAGGMVYDRKTQEIIFETM